MPFPRLIDPAALLPEPSPGRRPHRRSLIAFALLAIAFTLARHTLPHWPSTRWFGLGCALLIPVALLRGWPCRIALSLAFLLAGVGYFNLRLYESSPTSLLHHLSTDPLAPAPVLHMAGRIRTDPEPSTSGVTLTFAAEQLLTADRAAPVSGNLRIHIDAPPASLPPGLRAGRRAEFTGPVRPISPALNPAEPPRDLFAAQDGLVGSAILPSPDLITIDRTGDSTLETLRSELASWQANLHAAARRTLGLDHRDLSRGQALIAAMLLGEREPALAEAQSAFQRAGLMHLVAISGFNLMVLSFLAVLLIRLTGDHARLESILTALVIALYMFILPGEASILRAGLTLLFFLLTDAFGRRYDRLTLLGWTAILILLIHPLDLFSLGFQLSFGIVAALMAFGEAVHRRLWGVPIRGLQRTPAQRRPWRLTLAWFAEKLKLQVSAAVLSWAVAAPLIAHHTGLFSPLAVLTTLIVLPITILILWLGYTALLIGTLVPPLSEPISRLLAALGEFTVRTVLAIDQWPLATVSLPRLGPLFTLAATIIILYWLIRAHLRDWAAWLGAAMATAWLAALIHFGPRLDPAAAYRLDLLASGEAPCHLLRTADQAMLIGLGQSGREPRPEQLLRTLRALDAPRTPIVIIPDLRRQSWAALPGIIDRLGVRTVLVPAALHDAAAVDPSGPAAQLLNDLFRRRVSIRAIDAGDRFKLGSLVLTVLAPPDRTTPARRIILRIDPPTVNGATVLAAGASLSDLAALPAADTRCDSLVLPSTFRASDKPSEVLRRARALHLIHTGPPSLARDAAARALPFDDLRFTAAEGALRIQVGQDGRTTVGPSR